MTLTDKAALYKSNFPEILSKRMVEQLDDEVYEAQKHHGLICSFAFWDDTAEGWCFWFEVWELYHDYPSPTEAQILEVFNKHRII